MIGKTIRLEIDGQGVDFAEDPAVTIVEVNPMISDGQGSYTYPFTLPLTPHNNRLFGYPTRFTRAAKMDVERQGQLWVGARMYSVTVTVTSVSADTIGVSAAVDTGTVSSKFKEYMLAQFLDGEKKFDMVDKAIEHLSQDDLSGEAYDMVEDVCLSYPKEEQQRFVINRREDGKYQTKETDYVDSNSTSKNPNGYGIVPFLRLGWVLKKLFGQAFDTSKVYDTGRNEILIANNTVDAIVRGSIQYSQLVPEMKAVDFVAAVESIWGGKIVVQGGKPSFVSYNEWLETPVAVDLDDYLADRPVVEVQKPEQIKITQESKLARTSVDGLTFAKDKMTQTFKGDMAGDPPYETIHEASKVWTEMFQEGASSKDWVQAPNYQPYYNLFLMAKTSTKSDAPTTRANTILCGNTFAYDPDVLPDKKEINVQLAPALRTMEKGNIAVLIGANWLNTALTNIEDKKGTTSDCLCLLFKKPTGTVDIRGEFNPQTWGEYGIYKKYYAGYDMFLRHANQRISVKIEKRIALSAMGKYLLFGQPVLVEQITDNVAGGYYDVILRTARLQEPYDVEAETRQVDSVVKEVVKVVSEEKGRCVGTTRVVSQKYRRKYVWYDGRETWDDYDSYQEIYEPESPQCGFTPTFTLTIELHFTKCHPSGTVSTSAGAYDIPANEISMTVPVQDGDTAVLEGMVLTEGDLPTIDMVITKTDSKGTVELYNNPAIGQPATINQAIENIQENTTVTIEAAGYYEEKPPRP